MTVPTNGCNGHHGLTTAQVKVLLEGIHPSRVRTDTPNGKPYIAAWDVKRWLTRVFGFGGWDCEILTTDLVVNTSRPHPEKPERTQYTAAYRVTVRLVVKCVHGVAIARYDDGAVGDGQNLPAPGDAHDTAFKAAVSQALKRCAVNLGDQFGLSLRNKGPRYLDPTVIRSVAHDLDAGYTEAPVDGDTDAADDTGDEELSGRRNALIAQIETAITVAPDAPKLAYAGNRIAQEVNAGRLDSTAANRLRQLLAERKAQLTGGATA